MIKGIKNLHGLVMGQIAKKTIAYKSCWSDPLIRASPDESFYSLVYLIIIQIKDRKDYPIATYFIKII